MRVSSEKVIVPVVVALIGFAGTIFSALITANPPTKTDIKPSTLQCSPNIASKICLANLLVQINSDEPIIVNNLQRISLQVGDTLKVIHLNYCIPSEVNLNKLEAKAYLFKNGVESYQDVLLTPSQFPINTGVCHKIGNFQTIWKLEPGQHQVMIPIIKYDGSNRIVDKSFYFNLDVGS
ncbi:hypothetical protein H6G33_00015 [Calothrix sp. FACHB-1219]|uniref:hypothetical protein n=1 Tax=unclassified Calothrix TaxID=2619626 RepID=UPI001684FD97|nr:MULTISPECIES: hypothetical protein [unclassified Calothrix]MBD2200987.1 hypothetical protein [Calothrix sp. FACHB-168]MBD2215420.1 hypothetical protein [Calothrix sp. FACHB-1219]